MLRAVTGLSIAATLAGAVALYVFKHDNRRIEMRVNAHERTLEKIDGDIAVLKAERAYLAAPARIETLARKQGLAPVAPRQYVRAEDLARALGGTGSQRR